jgi:hypothetical protein
MTEQEKKPLSNAEKQQESGKKALVKRSFVVI